MAGIARILVKGDDTIYHVVSRTTLEGYVFCIILDLKGEINESIYFRR